MHLGELGAQMPFSKRLLSQFLERDLRVLTLLGT